MRKLDLRKQRFGRLVVLRKADYKSNNKVLWICFCDCKTIRIVSTNNLRSGNTKSCGCYGQDVRTTNGQYINMSAAKVYGRRRRQRPPLWADRNEIKKFYELRKPGHDVDHIVPLNGKYASGLHIAANLQYMPSRVNRKKQNKFLPYLEIKRTGERVLLEPATLTNQICS